VSSVDADGETVVASLVEADQGPVLGILAKVLDAINKPFGWLSPVMKMGLGLCGVLLLITLLLVIVVRMLTK
jgi:hypothetical protein